MASLLVTTIAGTALAAPGYNVTIPIDTVVNAPEGSVTELLSGDLPDDAAGQVCTVVSQAANQASVHPDNDLIVTSGSSQIVLPDVEAVPGGTVDGNGPLTLGATLVISLEMGPDEVFSGGFDLTFDCEIPDGRIIVVKEVTDGSSTSQAFDFTASYDGDGFSLSDGQQNDSGDLAPGTYSVAETIPDGWTLESAVCDDQSPVDAIELSSGETVTCTFTNSEDEVVLEPVVVTVDSECVVEDNTGVGRITVGMSVEGGASVTITDEGGAVVAVVEEDGGTVEVPVGSSYSWTATPAAGHEFAPGFEPSGTVDVDDCTPPDAPEGEIIVEKVVQGDGSQSFEFTFDTTGFTLGDNTLAHGQSSSSGPVTPGDGYSVSEQLPAGWELVSATCDDGSSPSNIDVSAGEQVTCTFTNQVEDTVAASIQVTVAGSCVVDGDDGEGLVDITMSVDDGATVVVRDSDGDVVGTLTEDGTISVPEGATYTWEATPNEGFEFPPGFASSGTITIETCSNPETLPFTGAPTEPLAMLGTVLLLSGVLVLVVGRGAIRWNEEL